MGLVLSVVAFGVGCYWLSKALQPLPPPQPSYTEAELYRTMNQRVQQYAAVRKPASWIDYEYISLPPEYFEGLINARALWNRQPSFNIIYESRGGRGKSPPPEYPCITNLDSLLSDIYLRFIQIRDSDFQLHYKVFDKVFQNLHQKMKEADPYYRKYSSTAQFAGSHYDNLRIKRPDEFDMDIIIKLPLNIKEHWRVPTESDIFIEPKAPAFVQLKMGVQFQKLPLRDREEWQNNKAAYEWMDDKQYLLRSKFLDWFKSVVRRGLNRLERSCFYSSALYSVDDVEYSIRMSESGPAVTLIIENKSDDFRLDVDLVPALKFPEERWPVDESYRPIPTHCTRDYWMVVGKPIKNGVLEDQKRSWRVALHNQERELMYDSGNLRQTVRLLKKLRDALGMTKIASYYIKTLFFWEIVERDSSFWQRSSPAFLFKLMVMKLFKAIGNQKIPYFWNEDHNLIGDVDERTLSRYAAMLFKLLVLLESPKDYKLVAKFLLTPLEFNLYNEKYLGII